MSIGESGRAVSNTLVSQAGPAGLLRRLLQGIGTVVERIVSRRGLALLFLAGAAVLALAGWLRPPLSPDLRSIHLPLGIWPGAGPAPEDVLDGPRRIPPDSAGGLALALLLI